MQSRGEIREDQGHLSQSFLNNYLWSGLWAINLTSLFTKTPISQLTLCWPQTLSQSFMPRRRQVELGSPSSHDSASRSYDDLDSHRSLSLLLPSEHILTSCLWVADPLLILNTLNGVSRWESDLSSASSLHCTNHPSAMSLTHFLRCK